MALRFRHSGACQRPEHVARRRKSLHMREVPERVEQQVPGGEFLPPAARTAADGMSVPELIVSPLTAEAARLHRAGRLDHAEARYRAALRADPGDATALHGIGMLRAQQGRLAEAVDLLAMAVAARPDFADAYSDLARVFTAMGRHEPAVAAHRRAIALAPADAGKQADLATALRHAGRLAEAADALRQAIDRDTSIPDWHGNLGVVLLTLRRFDEAVAPLRQAIAGKPGVADWQRALGVALIGTGQFEEAADVMRRTVNRWPDYAEAHYNLAQAIQGLGNFADAAGHFRRAIAIRPDYADAHGALAALLLLTGDLRGGFAAFRWRLRAADFPGLPGCTGPAWEGQSLAGKTLLVHCEQGFGDSLQFIRYVRPLRDRAARVLVYCHPALAALFRSIPGIEVITTPAGPGAADFHVPLLCLPRLFGTTLETIPAVVPYLSADPARVAHWAGCVAPHRRRVNVGLVWAGGAEGRRADYVAMDRRRSIALRQLAPLAGLAGVRFFSLQTGAPARQAGDPPAGLDLVNLTEGLHDFAETAALVTQLDLVISVDTSVAHLAGALGRPVWLLNRFDPCWRWLLGRDDSPWYPSLRQFRQPARGDWDSVIRAVRDALRHLAG